jgi:hypothetical protein
MINIVPKSGLIALVMLLPATAFPAPVPLLKIPELVQRADVIVIGRITMIGDIGPVAIAAANAPVHGRALLAEIAVDHVVKGAVQTATVRFQFDVPDVPMGYRGVAGGEYRVLFLRGTEPPYRFVSPYHPSVIAVPSARLAMESGLDQVFEAVAAVLSSPRTTSSDKREALFALRGAKNAVALAGLRSALSDGDRTVQLTAAAALLAANDVAGLPLATEALLETPSSLPGDVALNLRGAISHDLSTDAAVPALTQLFNATDATTRRAAVSALGRTQSPVAIASLARALDDSDFDVRLNAARACAEVTGQENLRPSEEAFRGDEHRFIGYWKSWFMQRKY